MSVLDSTKEYQLVKGTLCSICEENPSDIEIPTCLHLFCKSCTTTYISLKITEGEVLNLKCPSSDCSLELDLDLISLLLPDLLPKYLQFKSNKKSEQDPFFRWCPKAGCKGSSKKIISNELTCNKCNFKFCFICSEAFHKGSCSSLSSLKSRHLKPCPRCFVIIEKNRGCPEVSCSKCGLRFCWLCGQDLAIHDIRRCFLKSKKDSFYWVLSVIFLLFPLTLLFFIPLAMTLSVYLDEQEKFRKKFRKCFNVGLFFAILLSPVLMPGVLPVILLLFSSFITVEVFRAVKGKNFIKYLVFGTSFFIFLAAVAFCTLVFVASLVLFPVLGVFMLFAKTILIFIN